MATNDERQFSRLDFGFAHFFAERSKLSGEQKSRFADLLLELSAQQTAGHSCIRLNNLDAALIQASGLASSDDFTPFIVDDGHLYMHRYWRYEQRLAKQLCALIKQQHPLAQAENLLDRYFPAIDTDFDWQKQAAKAAISQGLTIITGGPGTGKTSTVLRILAVLQEASEQTLYIALAAPTGKAAMRLQESISNNKAALPCSPAVKDSIPENVATVHRLLGPKPPTPYFRHNADNPLPYDLVVVDECSMVDLALMSKLVDALKPGARLILLGDRDQLASVESGAVLADLTGSLPKHTVELKKSHRFIGDIKALADAVNHQQAALAWEILHNANDDTALLKSGPIGHIVENYLQYLQLMTNGADYLAIYQAFNQFRVLCANQHGRHSVTDINIRVEHELSKLNKIQVSGAWYPGRPIIITANNPALNLYNGDIGLCLPDSANAGQLRVFFLQSDGGVKKLQPARLTACDTVFAMTIHKSQGSEFEKVLILLPEQSNSVLSKELLYTAITRAKTQVKIAVKQEIFTHCIAHKIQRDSGLANKIRQQLRLAEASS